jgi:hypothetical protein
MNRTVLVMAALLITFRIGFAQLPGMDPLGLTSSPIWLVGRADVQKKLNLDKDQSTKAKALKKEFESKKQSAGKGANQNDFAASSAVYGTLKQSIVEYSQKATDLLNADQMQRLREIHLQVMGATCLLEPDIQKELNVDAAQAAELSRLSSQAFQKLMSEMQRGPRASGNAMKNYRKDLEGAMLPALTAEQQSKYRGMLGKPFSGVDKPAG